MRIVVGADDDNELTRSVVDELRKLGHETIELTPEAWPNIAARVAEDVATGRVDQGVLFCWTGTGTTMAANKVPGVRAALAWEPWIAEGARRWNDANVLVMSSQRVAPETARDILAAWFAVEKPDPDEADNIALLRAIEERHARREG
jgi:ribose 5-phosphate isomerase B